MIMSMHDSNSKLPYLATKKNSGLIIVAKWARINNNRIRLYHAHTYDLQDSHKLSSLIQNLVNNDITTYCNSKPKLYDPLTYAHLQPQFIDTYINQIVTTQQFHPESIQTKLQRLQTQLHSRQNRSNASQVAEPEQEQQSVSHSQDASIEQHSVNTMIDKLPFIESLNPATAYELNKNKIKEEFKLVDKVKRLRTKIVQEATGRPYLITDVCDLEGVDDEIIEKLCSKPPQVKLNGTFVPQSQVIKKKKCTQNYRIPALADQNQYHLVANCDLPEGTFLGLYDFKAMRKQQFTDLHQHPQLRDDHQSCGFALELLPVDSDTFRSVCNENCDETKLDKLIKMEAKASRELGLVDNGRRTMPRLNLQVDPHCHFGGSLSGCKRYNDRIMTLINDCRNDLGSLYKTQSDLERENVQFRRIYVNWYPYSLITNHQPIHNDEEVTIDYGKQYPAAITSKYYKQMTLYVNKMADKYTKA